MSEPEANLRKIRAYLVESIAIAADGYPILTDS